MNCSPCYLAKAEDCPRALACLRFFDPNMVYETAAIMLDPLVKPIGAPEPHTASVEGEAVA